MLSVGDSADAGCARSPARSGSVRQGALLPTRRHEAGHPGRRRRPPRRSCRCRNGRRGCSRCPRSGSRHRASRSAARDLAVLGRLELCQRARAVPDPHLVDDHRRRSRRPCPSSSTRSRPRSATFVAAFAGLPDRQRPVERAVEIQIPGRAVVGRRGVVPGGAAAIAVVPVIGWFGTGRGPALALLEVGDELAARRVDPEEIVDVRRQPSPPPRDPS